MLHAFVQGGRNRLIYVSNFDFVFRFLSVCVSCMRSFDVLGYRNVLSFVVLVCLLLMIRFPFPFFVSVDQPDVTELGPCCAAILLPSTMVAVLQLPAPRSSITTIFPDTRTLCTVLYFLPTGYLDLCTTAAPRALLFAARFSFVLRGRLGRSLSNALIWLLLCVESWPGFWLCCISPRQNVLSRQHSE